MTGPLGDSEFCFPETLIEVEGKQNSLFPLGSVIKCLMTKFCGVYKTWTIPANFCYFHWELNATVAYVAEARFYSHWHTEQI